MERDGPSPLHTPVAYALTPTLYGWIAHWNTTDVPNGSYDLFAVATVNGTSDSTPVTTLTTNITVDNPLPSVSIGTPNGAILSGSEGLSANVPDGATVSFLLTGKNGTTYLGESWDAAVGGPTHSVSHGIPRRFPTASTPWWPLPNTRVACPTPPASA